MEDEQIIELFWQRNEMAINECKIKYGQYCRSIAMNILYCAEDAQECENDTSLAAWDAIPPHRPNRLATFLGKMTRRIALDRRKASNAQKRGGDTVTLSLDELEGCIPGSKSIDDCLDKAVLTQSISTFLRPLPRRERQVFLRRYWYLDSITDIARCFGFTESKVKMMLLRTRQKLRQHLEKEGIFNEE